MSWQSLVRKLGAKCVECGVTDPRVLQIDHIYNDGFLDRLNFPKREEMIEFYLANPELAAERLQILCASDNWKKRHLAIQARKDYEKFIDSCPELLAEEETWRQFMDSCDLRELIWLVYQSTIINTACERAAARTFWYQNQK